VRETALYMSLVLLSLVEVFVGCAAEVVKSNIGHLKNGRKPDAGCAILPLVPILPIAYVLAAMGLNHFAPYLGYGTVAGISSINVGRSYWRYRKERPQLETLLAEQSNAN
jgi:hypothetical protein